jgi:hypothetical protein
MHESPNIVLELRKSEALVLFEWLASLKLGRHPNEPDEATQKLLWRVEGLLEKQLTEVVQPAYQRLVLEAKDDVIRHC